MASINPEKFLDYIYCTDREMQKLGIVMALQYDPEWCIKNMSPGTLLIECLPCRNRYICTCSPWNGGRVNIGTYSDIAFSRFVRSGVAVDLIGSTVTCRYLYTTLDKIPSYAEIINLDDEKQI